METKTALITGITGQGYIVSQLMSAQRWFLFSRTSSGKGL